MEMQETLALAERHLDARRYEEARRLLDSLVGISSVPDLARTFRTLQNRLGIVKVEAAQSALREATAAFAGHLGGMLATVIQTCSVAKTYTARGKMAPGIAMPASMDLRH